MESKSQIVSGGREKCFPFSIYNNSFVFWVNFQLDTNTPWTFTWTSSMLIGEVRRFYRVNVIIVFVILK
jgi:hypothetical protein